MVLNVPMNVPISILDALSDHLAILDEAGNILYVNSAWRTTASDNRLNLLAGPMYPSAIGANYLAACDAACADSSDQAPKIAQAIRQVISGECQSAHIEYPCHTRCTHRPPSGTSWFEVHITRFDQNGLPRVLLAHSNITERKEIEAEARRQLSELEAIYENGLAVGRLLDMGEIGRRVIEICGRYFSWHHVIIRLRQDDGDGLKLVAFSQTGLSDDESAAAELRYNTKISRVGQGLSGWVVQMGEIVRTGNVQANPQYVHTYASIRSGLYVPLKAGQRVIGCISVEDERPDAFSAQDERLLVTLASQAAVFVSRKKKSDPPRMPEDR